MSDVLPRRAFLGLAVRADPGLGVVVTRVLDGSMGEAAGIEIGDIVLAIDGAALGDVSALVAHLRGASSARSVSLSFLRDGVRHERTVPVVPMPHERYAGCEARYGHVVSNGHRLRTITVCPAAPRAALLFLQGIRCQSVDFALAPDAPTARFVRALAEEEIATVRVERPGIGDSEGGPCEAIDFGAELDCYDAALESTRANFDRVVLFGHSVGGIVAPLLARHHATPPSRLREGVRGSVIGARAGVAGLIVYGTSAERWSAALRQGLLRQLRLRGAPDLEPRLARFDDDPFAERSDGRARVFHEELERVDTASAWRHVHVPVLIVIGEHDWVVGADAQRAIASLAQAEIVELDGLDHAFTKHASLEASLRDYGVGEYDDRVARETARWIAGLP